MKTDDYPDIKQKWSKMARFFEYEDYSNMHII